MRTTLLTIFLACVISAMGQHTPLTSQYLFNGLLINPAYAGTRDAMAVNLTWRQQWVGFEGAPSTQVVSIHSPIKRSRLALGVLLVNDQIGVSRQTGVLTNIAYRLPFRKGKLQFGIGAGASLLQANWSALAVQERNDVQFTSDTRGSFQPNFSTGIFYYKKAYFIGASMPFVMSHSFNAERNSWTTRNDKAQYQPMITGGYVFKLNSEMKFKPTTLVRYQVAGGVQTDLSANLIIRDKIWTGISYRSKDSVVGSFEVLPTPQWRLGYAYDLGISAITPYHSGTHELMMQYEFGKRIHVRDPRYF